MARGGGAFVCAQEGFARMHRGLSESLGLFLHREGEETGNKEV